MALSTLFCPKQRFCSTGIHTIDVSWKGYWITSNALPESNKMITWFCLHSVHMAFLLRNSCIWIKFDLSVHLSSLIPNKLMFTLAISYLTTSNLPDNHDGVITHLEPDILKCEVKWALGSITANKASGGDGIPVELFQILKEDAVKVLHSIC